jgi:hypothetical protein
MLLFVIVLMIRALVGVAIYSLVDRRNGRPTPLSGLLNRLDLGVTSVDEQLDAVDEA